MPIRLTCVDYNSDWALKERFFHPKPVPGYLTREEVIAFFGSLGLAGVELMHAYWDDYSPAKLKALTADAGLPIVSYIIFVDLIAPRTERRPALDAAFALLDRTAELGAPYTMLIAATQPSDAPLSQQRGWLAEGLRACAEHAAKVGVTVLAENIDFPPLRPLMGRGADCRDLCAAVASPTFRLIFDVCATVFVDEDPLDALQVMWPYVAHVHVKNCRQLPIGENAARALAAADGQRYAGADLDRGVIDIPLIVRELRRLKYDGHLLFEYQGEADPRVSMPHNLAYLRRLLSETGLQAHD